MSEKTFYIILTDTGTFFTRMIKLYTKKPYNHTSISFDSILMDVYSFGRKTPRNPFIGGFVKEDMNGSIFKQARGAIYRVQATEEQINRMKDFIKKIEENKHKYRYNLLGVLAITINKQIERNHAYFCSQFVATVLQEGGVTKFKKPLSFITPYDILDELNLQLVYEGNIEEFQQEHHVMINRSMTMATHS